MSLPNPSFPLSCVHPQVVGCSPCDVPAHGDHTAIPLNQTATTHPGPNPIFCTWPVLSISSDLDQAVKSAHDTKIGRVLGKMACIL